MARKHVAARVKKLEKHRLRHRKKVWATFRKMAKCHYKKGGMMLMGAGMKKKKGGMMLMGAGMKNKKKGGMMLMGAGMKKKKMPKWVTSKTVPKSGFPEKPKGMDKKGGWLWNRHKKQAKQVQAKAKSHISKLWAKGKEMGSKLLGKAGDMLAAHADQLMDKGVDILSKHMDDFGKQADTWIDSQGGKY